MPALRHCAALTCITLLQLASLCLFFRYFFAADVAQRGVYSAHGFSPQTKEPRPGHPDATGTLGGAHANASRNATAGDSAGKPALYDSLVMLVIDALPVLFLDVRAVKQANDTRYELPREALAMPFVDKLLRHPGVHGFNMESATPAMTSLRVKTILAGVTAGNIVEISNAYPPRPFVEDNLIAQMRLKGWNISVLGDNPWVEMFPGAFCRSAGPDSFFVRDSYEVDNFIKRHIPYELDPGTEWNMLILHFSGVDHIGHTQGRAGQLMLPKLSEMDAVIEDVHARLRARDVARGTRSLLLVLSDHGMNAKGSHGGFSSDELNAITIFIPADVNVTDTDTNDTSNVDKSHTRNVPAHAAVNADTSTDHTRVSVDKSDTSMPANVTVTPNNHTGLCESDTFPTSSTGARGAPGASERNAITAAANPARDDRAGKDDGTRADPAVAGPPSQSDGPGNSAAAGVAAAAAAAAAASSSSGSSSASPFAPSSASSAASMELARDLAQTTRMPLPTAFLTDLAPTLALLFGLPIPAQCEGVPLAPVLDRLPPGNVAALQPTTGRSPAPSSVISDLDILRRMDADVLEVARMNKRRGPRPTRQGTVDGGGAPTPLWPLALLLATAMACSRLLSAWNPGESPGGATRGDGQQGLGIHEWLMGLPGPWSALMSWAVQLASVAAFGLCVLVHAVTAGDGQIDLIKHHLARAQEAGDLVPHTPPDKDRGLVRGSSSSDDKGDLGNLGQDGKEAGMARLGSRNNEEGSAKLGNRLQPAAETTWARQSNGSQLQCEPGKSFSRPMQRPPRGTVWRLPMIAVMMRWLLAALLLGAALLIVLIHTWGVAHELGGSTLELGGLWGDMGLGTEGEKAMAEEGGQMLLVTRGEQGANGSRWPGMGSPSTQGMRSGQVATDLPKHHSFPSVESPGPLLPDANAAPGVYHSLANGQGSWLGGALMLAFRSVTDVFGAVLARFMDPSVFCLPNAEQATAFVTATTAQGQAVDDWRLSRQPVVNGDGARPTEAPGLGDGAREARESGVESLQVGDPDGIVRQADLPVVSGGDALGHRAAVPPSSPASPFSSPPPPALVRLVYAILTACLILAAALLPLVRFLASRPAGVLPLTAAVRATAAVAGPNGPPCASTQQRRPADDAPGMVSSRGEGGSPQHTSASDASRSQGTTRTSKGLTGSQGFGMAEGPNVPTTNRLHRKVTAKSGPKRVVGGSEAAKSLTQNRAEPLSVPGARPVEMKPAEPSRRQRAASRQAVAPAKSLELRHAESGGQKQAVSLARNPDQSFACNDRESLAPRQVETNVALAQACALAWRDALVSVTFSFLLFALMHQRRADAGAVLVAAVEGFALASLLASATVRTVATGGTVAASSLGPPWEVVLIFQGWGYATFFGLGNTNGFGTVDVVSPLMGLESTIGTNMTIAQVICFLNTFTPHILASLFAGICHANWLSAQLPSRPVLLEKPAAPGPAEMPAGPSLPERLARPAPTKRLATLASAKRRETGRVVLQHLEVTGTLISRPGGSAPEALQGPAGPDKPAGHTPDRRDEAPYPGLECADPSHTASLVGHQADDGCTPVARNPVGVARDSGRWPLLRCALVHWAVTAAVMGAAVAFFCIVLVSTHQGSGGRGRGGHASRAFTPKFYYLLFELLQAHVCGLLFHVAPAILLPCMAGLAGFQVSHKL
eukprot:jgi/Mesvir1/7434/Mv19215-RA.1